MLALMPFLRASLRPLLLRFGPCPLPGPRPVGRRRTSRVPRVFRQLYLLALHERRQLPNLFLEGLTPCVTLRELSGVGCAQLNERGLKLRDWLLRGPHAGRMGSWAHHLVDPQDF